MELLKTILLMLLLAEVTYLVVKLPRQNMPRKQGRPILVDTSVLIDGRIISVAKSGFISDKLVIPRSVIGELQFLADNADHDKRARARYGLDVVTELQQIPEVKIEILQDGSKAEEGVDERLLSLAKKHQAAVCTIDYNLNKVAVVEGVAVLNVNELAQSLRMAYLPGEKIMLDLVQKGQDTHQAIGHLPDGTMVVVERASKLIGQTVEIEFIRSLQTAAGKMMFARCVEKNIQSQPARPPQPTQQKQRDQHASHVLAQSESVQTFHSDSLRPRRANTNRNVPRAQPDKPELSSNNGIANDLRHSNVSNKRPRTSSDREAAFIDLVDKS